MFLRMSVVCSLNSGLKLNVILTVCIIKFKLVYLLVSFFLNAAHSGGPHLGVQRYIEIQELIQVKSHTGASLERCFGGQY